MNEIGAGLDQTVNTRPTSHSLSGVIERPSNLTTEKPVSSTEDILFSASNYLTTRRETPEDKDQAAALKLPIIYGPDDLPNFIMKRPEVAVLTGVQPETYGLHRLIEAATFVSLQQQGFDPVGYALNWESAESWPEKIYGASDFVGHRGIEFGAGMSMGGTAAAHLEAVGRLTRVVTLNSPLQRKNETNAAAIEYLESLSPSVKSALEELPDPKDSKNYMCYFAKGDERVPPEIAQIKGANNIRVKVPRILNVISPKVPFPIIHEFAIADRLIRGGEQMAKHFKG